MEADIYQTMNDSQLGFLEIVDPTRIVSEVKATVADSRKEILATALLLDELANPLPPSYHQLLREKTRGGVQITRIGFGNKEQAQRFQDLYPFDSENYSFALNPNVAQYQRMIIIDSRDLFFKVGETFVHSKHSLLVEAFRKYFFTLKPNSIVAKTT